MLAKLTVDDMRQVAAVVISIGYGCPWGRLMASLVRCLIIMGDLGARPDAICVKMMIGGG